ncbi:hypothetical protein B0H16DRAFT_1801232 [Mycena metata]|uniref:Uncharacterized protein n=1 Tax=Mycena metata TaxID=1033252 RepID=A0AAD7NIW0_9AGAR|nr:hypothetical protein B0H16DRAFT_1801232 [Mycena metata]
MGRRLQSVFVRQREFAFFDFLGGGGGGTAANLVLDAEGSCTLSLVPPPRWDARACGPRVYPCLPPSWSFRIAPGAVRGVRTLAVAMLARFFLDRLGDCRTLFVRLSDGVCESLLVFAHPQTDVFAASHSPASPVFTSSRTPAHRTATAPTSSPYSHGLQGKEKDGKPETKRWVIDPCYCAFVSIVNDAWQPTPIRRSTTLHIPPIRRHREGLFYLDFHHFRPSVPLRPFLGEPLVSAHGHPSSSSTTSSHPDDLRSLSPEAYTRGGSKSPESGSARGGSMSGYFDFPRGGSMSPDCGPLTPAEEAFLRARVLGGGAADVPLRAGAQDADERAGSEASEHAYWFVCWDEAEWVDLRRRRVEELPRTIFAIVDEQPMWPGADDDDDMGLESMSDSEVFHSNHFGVDVDDDHRIVVLAPMDGLDPTMDEFLRLHFRFSLSVQLRGGDIRDEYPLGRILAMMDESGVPHAMTGNPEECVMATLSDVRWQTVLGRAILADTVKHQVTQSFNESVDEDAEDDRCGFQDGSSSGGGSEDRESEEDSEDFYSQRFNIVKSLF